MNRIKIACTWTLVFLVLGFGRSQAAWILEGQVWRSPYQEGELYLSQLGVVLEPHEDLDFSAFLPIQYSRGPELQKMQCLYPRFSLIYRPSFDPIHSAILRMDYHPKPQKLSLQGGISMLHDPLAMNLAISYHENKFSLEGSLIFAVNERWALGAHLHYARNSLLTYEVFHTSRKGKQRQIRYSRYLDGSMQSLGFKLTL